MKNCKVCKNHKNPSNICGGCMNYREEEDYTPLEIKKYRKRMTVIAALTFINMLIYLGLILMNL